MRWDRGSAGGLDHPPSIDRPHVHTTDQQKAQKAKTRRQELQMQGFAIRQAEHPVRMAEMKARIARKKPQ